MRGLRLFGAAVAAFLIAAEVLAQQPTPRPRPAPAPAAPRAAPAVPATPPAGAPRPAPAAEAPAAPPVVAPAVQQAAPALEPLGQEVCTEVDHPNWGENERWAWQRLCAGEVADFNKRDGADAPRRNPREPGVWDKTRLLSPRFLPTVLYAEPFRSVLPQAGARIAGAWLAEPVDLKGGLALAPLSLDYSRIDGALDLSDARFAAYLSLTGSILARPASLARLRVDGQVLLADTRVAGALALGGARLGELTLDLAVIGGALDLAGADIAGRLTLRATRIDGVLSLEGARIGGGALFERATLADAVNLANLQVAHDLAFAAGTRINGRLTLRGARIRGLLDASEAGFGGPLATQGLEIAGPLLLRRASFAQPAELTGASIGQALDLSGARLAGLDLSDTRIGGELRFGTNGNAPIWGDGARLSLTRTQAEALAAPFEVEAGGEVDAGGTVTRRAAWPPAGGVDLAGFAYRRLADAEPGAPAPTLEGQLAWMALDAEFSPQPYQQLAAVLRAAGAAGDARSVIYAGKERARAEALRSGAVGAYAAATVLKATIGYGLGWRILRALGWVAALTVLGALVLWRVPATRQRGLSWGLTASFDQLLPLIEFDREHGEAIARDLGRYGRAYFTLHQLAGWALSALVLAALVGLTQG